MEDLNPRGTPLSAFLDAFAEDVAKDEVRPLADYLARFPGNDDGIVGEYRAFTSRGAAHTVIPQPGSNQLGPYRIVRQIGRGGQATVYLAHDTRLGREVALKVLDSGHAPDSAVLDRFRREAEITSKLDHPGICAVYELGNERGVLWIAMRYVDGETVARTIGVARSRATSELASHVTLEAEGDSEAAPPAETTEDVDSSTGPHTWAEICRTLHLIERVARALHVAHEHGVIHRDIKPGNLMISKDGEPVILDFGLAQEVEGEQATLTLTGDLMGTPHYMSPEQIAAHRIKLDRRTDVYSLGVTLFECLTLRRPFEAPTREGLYHAILTKNPPDIRRLNDTVPRDVRIVLETAMEKDRDRRYQSALDLAEDLRRVRSFEPIHARPVALPTRFARWVRRSPAVASAVIGAFLMLTIALGLTIYFLEQMAKERTATEAELKQKLVAWEERDQERSAKNRERLEKEAIAEQLRASQRRVAEFEAIQGDGGAPPVRTLDEGAASRPTPRAMAQSGVERPPPPDGAAPIGVSPPPPMPPRAKTDPRGPPRGGSDAFAAKVRSATKDLDDIQGWLASKDFWKARAALDATTASLLAPQETPPDGGEAPAVPDHLLSKAGRLAYQLGALENARKCWERALEIRTAALGADHQDVQRLRQDLAVALFGLGDLKGARELLESAITVISRARPDDDPELQKARGSLAITLSALGDAGGAKALQEKVLAARAKVLPDDHPDLQSARANLAITMANLGDLAGAKALDQKVLDVRCKTLPEDHPDLQKARLNLAVTIKELGDVQGAKVLEEKVMNAFARTLPPDHPDFQAARQNLATSLRALGDLQKAKALETAALEATERSVGPDHPDTARGRSALARTLFALKDYAGARPLQEKALASLSKLFPQEHLGLQPAREELALTLRALGDLAAARVLMQSVVDVRARALPSESPTLERSRQNLATIVSVQEAASRRARE